MSSARGSGLNTSDARLERWLRDLEQRVETLEAKEADAKCTKCKCANDSGVPVAIGEPACRSNRSPRLEQASPRRNDPTDAA